MSHQGVVTFTNESNFDQLTRAYSNDAGYDLRVSEDAVINPGEMKVVETGVRVACPDDVCFHLIGRSSTVAKRGLMVIDGLIDPGYRGYLFVRVWNFANPEPAVIKSGEAIAQCVFQTVPRLLVTEATELPPSDRGSNGFGSSGASASPASDSEATISEFAGEQEACRAIFNQRYLSRGPANVTSQGLPGIYARMKHDKMARLERVVRACQPGVGMPDGVDIRDVVDDLRDVSNYALMCVLILTGKWR